MIILETERLYFCKTTADDAPFILEILNSPTYLRYIGDRGVRTLDDARAYIEERFTAVYQRQNYGFYTAKLKSNDQPIGTFGVIKRDNLPDVDIGYALLPKFIGQGFGFEGASAIMDYARNTLGFKKLLAITVEYNHASIKLLEKLGFEYERTVRLPDDPEELMLFGHAQPLEE